MFDNLLGFLRGKKFLEVELADFERMLNDTESMFKEVCVKLLEGKYEKDIKDRIYKLDREVNHLEKDIRKRVVEHLSLRGNVDLPMCLILMSVVKDAERLGDYAKNLYEVTEILGGAVDRNLFNDLLLDIDKKIMEEFRETKQAFIKSDKDTARNIFKIEREVSLKCEEAVRKLANGNYPTRIAVCMTLVARHFKRISAHLSNIGSSVILPLQDLDFFDEKLK